MRGSDRRHGWPCTGAHHKGPSLQAIRALGIPESKGTLQNNINPGKGIIRFVFQKGHSGCLDKDSCRGQEWKEGDQLTIATIQKKGKGSLGNRRVNKSRDIWELKPTGFGQ